MPKKAPKKNAPKKKPPPRQPPRPEHFHKKPVAPSAEEAPPPSEHERRHWRSKISEKPAEKPPIVEDIGDLQQENEQLRAKCDGLENKLEAETKLRKEQERKVEIAKKEKAASDKTNMQAVGMMQKANDATTEKIRKMNNDLEVAKKFSDSAIAHAEGEAKRFEAQVAELEEDNEDLLQAFGLCDDERVALQAKIDRMAALGKKARAVGRGRDSASSSSGGPSSPSHVGSADSKRRKKKKTKKRRRRNQAN